MLLYFHLKDAHEIILDDEGVEVSGTHEARIQALLAVDELQGEDPRNWLGWTLEVTDAAPERGADPGRRLARLTFAISF